ncbi:Biotin biosynthesis cytochrome P450 [Paraburkholderia nemoris]|nr:Biotin biosynthesis cytochrome P450 [Paraburkholderia nemoris]CAE6809661.1 Biotin biosynthesis cytochrome P450 [Paraburkholderia nemoris]
MNPLPNNVRSSLAAFSEPNSTVDSIIPLILGNGTNDPYPIYDHLRRTEPVYRDASGVWLISSHEIIVRILQNSDQAFRTQVTSKHPACLKDMILLQGQASHDRLRRLMTPLFCAEAVSDLQAFVTQDVAHLLAPLAHLSRFNLAEVALELPIRTICRMLGIAPQQSSVWLRASGPAMQLMGSLFLTDAERAHLEQGTQHFVEMLESYIDSVDRDATPDHPVSRFLRLEEQGEISRSEIVGNFLFLFVTGFVTTTVSIGNVIALALRDRSIWQRWCADRSSIRSTVRELMRYDTAAHAIIRYASRDIELGGRQVRRGDRILLLLGAANRDPHEFESPDEIDPNRKEGRWLTFGIGAHACIGRMLSIMQIEVLVGALIDCMPELSIDEDKSKRCQNGRVHGYRALWLNNTQMAEIPSSP